MKPRDFDSLSLNELWSLREQVDAILAQKISAEKIKLNRKLRQLSMARADRSRRPYPPVRPKYVNPAEPSQTWAGRGRLPHWAEAQLRSGKQLDDFRIPPSSDRGPRIVHRN
jgi:DNA-binding protein H-NS